MGKKKRKTVKKGEKERNNIAKRYWYGKVEANHLFAEDGYWYGKVEANHLDNGENVLWQCIDGNEAISQQDPSNNNWQKITMHLMSTYARRTQGAVIEQNGSCIYWHYNGCERSFGKQQAANLYQQLEDLLNTNVSSGNSPTGRTNRVSVESGNGYVQVRLKGVSKGSAMITFVLHADSHFDFCLCIGNDTSDEDMFEVAKEYFANLSKDRSSSHTGSGGDDGPPNAHMHYTHISRKIQKSLRDSQRTSFQNLHNAASNQFKIGYSPRPRTSDLKDSAIAEAEPYSGKSEDSNGKEGSQKDNPPQTPKKSTNLEGRRVFTATVGRKPSAAQYYIPDITKVQDMIIRLSDETSKSQTIGLPKNRNRIPKIKSVPAMSGQG